jgi:RNA polymerase sigma-70 factor (ECF subfamily)
MKRHFVKVATAGGTAATASLEATTEQLRRDMNTLLSGPESLELANFAFSLAKNGPEAEELVQAACVKAFRYAASYDPKRPLIAWLKTILRNSFCDGRRQARLTVSLDDDAHTSGGVTLGDCLAASELPADVRLERERGTAVLLRAVAELPIPAREVVSLCDVEGLTYEAAAVRLRLPLGTVRSRLSRGHRVLRENVLRLTDSVKGGTYDRALQPV